MARKATTHRPKPDFAAIPGEVRRACSYRIVTSPPWRILQASVFSLTLLQRAVRSPDPWFQVHDRWLVRRLAPDAFKIDLPSSKEDARLAFAPALLRAMGFETANVHLGTRSLHDLQLALDSLRRDLGQDWLVPATERMEQATRKDHSVWAKYWKRHARMSQNENA